MGRKKRASRGGGKLSWEDAFERIVFGILDIQPKQLEQYTMRQLYNKWMGRNAVDHERNLEAWHRMRLSTYTIALSGGNMKAGFKMQSIIKLPGDAAAQQLSRDAANQRDAMVLKWLKQQKAK